jgi:uncharacterized membrane-anchored protein YitT (DUF2179 family)
METRRWTNPTQPQMLQIAVFLLYFNAVILALFGGIFSPLGLPLIVGGAAGGFGIANERRWGYNVALAVAAVPFVFLALALLYGGFSINPISLLFDIALAALLLHPQSREYQRIWFR